MGAVFEAFEVFELMSLVLALLALGSAGPTRLVIGGVVVFTAAAGVLDMAEISGQSLPTGPVWPCWR